MNVERGVPRRANGRGAGRPCVFCGLWPGNAAGAGGREIAVFSYTLLRSVYVREAAGRTRTRSFGTLSICERCRHEWARGATMGAHRDGEAV